ncbi:diaminopimelate epimerase [Ruminococcus champanellensis]|uniref:diaminopimelate epimerase n=1 Tax=Ruminococcus champanellensis TaxID=1161942 RepID=UPI0023EF9E44|nr:diaminopimelate epimerase [Ruminococcus champanellensis]MED9891515.1 diaminopimelate epimerase [Ruminococcus champanellensis]
MKFTKMQGIGNDYIYVNCFEEQVVNPEQLSVRLSDRRFGIGGDGLILIMPSQIADFKMRIFNADGSEAMMCGNGTRCIGKYVYEHGLANKTHITLETNSGIKYLELHCTGDQVTSVTVDMGKAILTPREIPVESDSQEPFVAKPVQVGDRLERLTCVSVGNPHAIVFCDRVEDLDLEKLGPLFEHHAIFPDRVNTEFVRVIDDHTLQMRVWERGSGETLACGTGACATTVAAVLNGYCPQGEPILVKLRGGDLTITYQADGTVMMTGPAEEVFQGEINL